MQTKEIERCNKCFTIVGDFKKLNEDILHLKNLGHYHFETRWLKSKTWLAVLSTKQYKQATGNIYKK